jgi:hypothetical protein
MLNSLKKKLIKCEDIFSSDENILIDYLEGIYDGNCSVPSAPQLLFLYELCKNNKTIIKDGEDFKIIDEKCDYNSRFFKMLLLVTALYLEHNKATALLDDELFKIIFSKALNENERTFIRSFAHSFKYLNEKEAENVIDYIIELLSNDLINSSSILSLINLIIATNKNLRKSIINKAFNIYKIIYKNPEKNYLENIIDNNWFGYLSDELKSKLIKELDELYSDELEKLVSELLELDKIDDIYFEYIIKIFDILLERKEYKIILEQLLPKLFEYNFDKNKKEALCNIVKKVLDLLYENDLYVYVALHANSILPLCHNLKKEWENIFVLVVKNNNCKFAERIANEVFKMNGNELYNSLIYPPKTNCYKIFIDEFFSI